MEDPAVGIDQPLMRPCATRRTAIEESANLPATIAARGLSEARRTREKPMTLKP